MGRSCGERHNGWDVRKKTWGGRILKTASRDLGESSLEQREAVCLYMACMLIGQIHVVQAWNFDWGGPQHCFELGFLM
jgi:hypothetical protein